MRTCSNTITITSTSSCCSGSTLTSDQMSAEKEYCSLLIRSGDMYVTVPKNVLQT